MAVEIEVGHGLDRVIARPAQTAIGRMVLGPLRLLTWLETRFGKELPEVSFSARAMEYLTCLKECDGEHRFFHRSLQQDELGVAGELLRWRDKWYEAGWTGPPFQDNVSNRLRDMADVDLLAKDRVGLGIGQRVQRLVAALPEEHLGLSITLIDPLETHPVVWRRLFQALGAGVRPWTPGVNAEPGSDLAAVYRGGFVSYAVAEN